MSIASEEAVELWPEPVGPEERIRVWAHENHLLRAGYEHGRTAEPTEAEIEAGAMAIFRTLITSAHPMSDSDYADAWNCIATMQKDQFKRQSQAVLKAARKAVTE
jgi:erythromycin esterase-like protein